MLGATRELEFYRYLRRFDPAAPEVNTAIALARTWADLALRYLAALAAQQAHEVYLPPAFGLPLLAAVLEHGPHFTVPQVTAGMGHDWQELPGQELAELAHWLAQAFKQDNPLATAYQVWVGHLGAKQINLYGPTQPTDPPAPLNILPHPPIQDWISARPGAPAALLAHYDVHGVAMLALSLRHMQGWGASPIDCSLSFEWTGDIGKLWKRAVPKAITADRGYAQVVLIDCSIHSRNPERTLAAIHRLDNRPQTQLVICDHHIDTFLLAPQLLHDRLQLVLANELTCGLYDCTAPVNHNLMVLGALGDKVHDVALAYPAERHPDLHAALDVLNRWLVHYSPTPPELKQQEIQPLEKLWDELSSAPAASPALITRILGEPPAVPAMVQPAYAVCGSLLIVTDKLESVGRTWYALLERLLLEAEVPYALALRVLNGTRANLLLLTQWSSPHVPPGRLFIPEHYLPRCLGHPGAVWADLALDEALPFVEQLLQRLNSFMGTPGNLSQTAPLLKRNILNATPSPTLLP